MSRQALVAPSWSSISPAMSSSVSLLPSGAGFFPSVPAVSWSSPQFVSAELPVQRPDQRLSSPLVTPMVSAALPPSWSFVPGSSTPLTQASSAWVQAPPVLRAQDQNQALAQFQAQAQALAQAQTALAQAQTQAQAQALAQARAQAQAQALALAQMQAVTPAAVAPSLVSFPQPQAPSRVPPMPPLPQAPMSSWPAAGPSTVPPALVASAVPSLASAGFTQFPLPGIAGMTQTSIQGGPPHNEAFVVGPGFHPVPYKTVVAITSGQFVQLASLLSKPDDASAGPTISLDGRVIIAPATRPPRRLSDIVQWLQAFSIYASVLVATFPGRARDLWAYQLLILRTYAQFRGLAWLNYDEAFRRDAAARHITDWSSMHLELYNYHTSATVRVQPSQELVARQESSGAVSGTTICRSWNSGRCIGTRAFCRYLHVCDVPSCRGAHRRTSCPRRTVDSSSPRM